MVLLATATDGQTGVRRVSLRGELTVICIPATGTTEVRLADPVADDQVTPSGGSTLPGQLAKQYRLNVPANRQRCPTGTSFAELTLRIRAEAENGVGQLTRLPELSIASFGPDILRVATFNLYRPGNHADSVYQSWGATLGSQADVLLLTEVEDRRRAELIATAAGMPYVAVLRETDSDIAIASRGPLRNIVRRTLVPPGSTYTSAQSNILSAETIIGGYPHQVIATHWGIRDANNVAVSSADSVPGRLVAANTILGLLTPAPAPVIVGGDLNALHTTTEVSTLRASLTDTYLGPAPTTNPDCADNRIDYVLFRGPYLVKAFDGCTATEPSDHPFMLATLEVA